MTSKIGSKLSTFETGLKKFGGDFKAEVKDLKADVKVDVKKGWGAGTTGVLKDTKDGFFDLGAETVGVAELAGLRYPVSAYESKVSDGLTRGSRIDDPAGYDKLKAQGFKGIVDLTLEGTNDAVGGAKAGLNTLNVKILDNSAPTEAQMKQFLDFATDPANSPAYVHCEAGKGRTGVAVASYRMAVQGWPPEVAIAEAKKLGLALPNQIDFLQQFGADLSAGKIEGYPKQ
jgi:hypothetical protein